MKKETLEVFTIKEMLTTMHGEINERFDKVDAKIDKVNDRLNKGDNEFTQINERCRGREKRNLWIFSTGGMIIGVIFTILLEHIL